jgi:hypothetical protein
VIIANVYTLDPKTLETVHVASVTSAEALSAACRLLGQQVLCIGDPFVMPHWYVPRKNMILDNLLPEGDHGHTR